VSRVLNLGLDSFVFIDDMPFERNLVREAQPLVAVPEMPDDPSEFVAAIERSGLLESAGFSEDDARRNLTYREEALRTTEQIKYGSIDDYLASLDMKSESCLFQKDDIPRVAQLIQRSNQFNLRTQRVSESQCVDYLNDGRNAFGVQVRLADRFGDYGLIAVICCDVIDESLFVTELVMSCRVLKRGVEGHIMNFLFAECERRGLRGVKGEYIATAKNALVKDFYAQFNFELIDDNGKSTTWFLPHSAYEVQTHYIK
jgi:FkbH-like protein